MGMKTKQLIIPAHIMTINGYDLLYSLYNEEGKNAPIIVLNGGPGGSFTSYYPYIKDIAIRSDRPILFYNQVGGGKEGVNGKEPSFWTMERWIDELMEVVKHFGFGKAILLGHSFGGMLAIASTIERRPAWLSGLILSSTLCSSKMWEEDTMKIVESLPKKVRETLKQGIKDDDYDSEEYRRAEAAYYRKCVNPKYRYSSKKPPKNEAYLKAWGPSEFAPQGTLKDYDYSGRLEEIEVPTLLLCGSEDESTPRANEYMFSHLSCPKKKVVLEGLHHCAYREGPEFYISEVISFLQEYSL